MSKTLFENKTTQMESLALKNRMKLAERRHDLLREKQDSSIMEFFNAIAQILDDLEKVDDTMTEAFSVPTQVKTVMGPVGVVAFAYASRFETE